MVSPVANAESERIFSAMKTVKLYLCNKMTNKCLNHLMVMHVHKDLYNLNFIDVGDTIVGANQRRKNAFGVFSNIIDCKINGIFTRDSSLLKLRISIKFLY